MQSSGMSPGDVVRLQLDAYNARDIQAFMATWADQAEYYQHPDVLLASGHEQIRQRHLQRFQEADLFAELISRSVIDQTVIDHEKVTRNLPEGKVQMDVCAIYQIEHEKIARVWFISGNRKVIE